MIKPLKRKGAAIKLKKSKPPYWTLRQCGGFLCAGHGAVLAGESPVMDNLPSM